MPRFGTNTFIDRLPNVIKTGGSSGVPGILDAYTGAAFAFASDVLIYSAHSVTDNAVGSQTEGDTGAFTVRVRRSSDNAVRSFLYSEVSDGTLLTWVGAGNDGFVNCAYDQGTGGNHAVQTTAATQPPIVVNGALATVNGKAALCFTNHVLISNTISPASSTSHCFSVTKLTDNFSVVSNKFLGVYGLRNIRNGRALKYDTISAPGIYIFNGSVVIIDTANLNNQKLISSYIDSAGAVSVYVNSGANVTGNNGTDNNFESVSLGSSGSLLERAMVDFQLFVAFASDQSTNRTAIEQILNSTYNIY